MKRHSELQTNAFVRSHNVYNADGAVMSVYLLALMWRKKTLRALT
ncbi:hypothetical protein [Hyphomicrobium sp. CS1BSMeth3]|jgi:hypothetical protein|nr:hypothetical protein [Hyphomicrobium sp. CS1BSMeth3]